MNWCNCNVMAFHGNTGLWVVSQTVMFIKKKAEDKIQHSTTFNFTRQQHLEVILFLFFKEKNRKNNCFCWFHLFKTRNIWSGNVSWPFFKIRETATQFITFKLQLPLLLIRAYQITIFQTLTIYRISFDLMFTSFHNILCY